MKVRVEVRRVLVLVAVAALLVGCAGGSGEAAVPSVAPVTITVTQEVPPSSPATTPSAAAGTTASAQPRVVSVDPGVERTLTLADAFDAGDWKEGSFQAVGHTQASQALAQVTGCYGSHDPLEFRFAQNQGTLRFTVAQSMDSESSGAVLEWALIVDGRQIQTKSIGFKDSAELTTSLAGVAVVQLDLEKTGSCAGTATGLVLEAVIQG